MQKTILTVDDSTAVRMLISLTLTQAGYRVLEAANGREALALMSDEQIDLVLSDLNMPQMDGIELIRGISSLYGPRKVPVIMLTTEHQRGRLAEAREAGAAGWMFKPFKTGDLLAAVETVLERCAVSGSGRAC
jgi:two-component system chemotaxis response regulator CheY